MHRTKMTWQHQDRPVHPPVMTYLCLVLAHRLHKETARGMVTTQLQHDLNAYSTLPLNGYEQVAIINAVLVPTFELYNTIPRE